MATEIITTSDLQNFKVEMLEGIKLLLQEVNNSPSKRWLKSSEVRKILNVSPGTLQNLRLNGALPYTKIGGVIYYDSADIQQMLEENKIVRSGQLSLR